jgi:predicted acyltransferase
MPRERLLSLDVFRGLTIAGMLLVNDPGSWSTIYPPLRHADWHGWTPTDLIFPFFLFIVGITTHLSMSARRARGDDEGTLRRQILRRGAVIFVLGLLLNGFPFFTWAAVPGVEDPTILQRVVHRLEVWRIMGVLQRIGLAYIAAGLLSLGRSPRFIVGATAVLLFGYWFAMTLLPVPGLGVQGMYTLDTPGLTLAAWVDRMVLDWSGAGLGNHIWAATRTWDPEGVLSTLPAIGTTLIGVLAGRWLATDRPLSDRLAGLFAVGAIGLVVGQMWHWVFPINKGIWTSSYVVFSAGAAAVTLATVMWIVDAQGVRRWTKPFVIYGTNPILAFVGSGIMARTIYSIIRVEYQGAEVPLQSAIYQSMFLSWLGPYDASLAFAFAFVLLWLGILWLLYRRGIFLKV